MWKKFFTCFLCCLLVAIPLVQRSYAAVTTITVVTILILTILTAMGITLVVSEGSKEAFIQDKGDAFMSSKGYSGSFADWISGGTAMDISLKLGTLMVAKAVVDRIKEFVSWLVPSAASNTVVDLSDGTLVINPVFNVVSGSVTVDQARSWYYAPLSSSRVYVSSLTMPFTITDDSSATLLIRNAHNYGSSGYYDQTDTYISSPSDWNGSSAYNLLLVCIQSLSTLSLNGHSVTVYPGVYISSNENSTSSSARLMNNVSINGVSVPRKCLSLNNDFIQSSSVVDVSAIIGDYDDLSDLTTTNTEGTGGTTIINNTFYIAQDGQALNPSGQTLDDIIDALRQALESDKREVTVTGTTAATLAAGEAAPNYSDFQLGNLDLSGLGALLTTRFPFSIPWDLVRIFEVFVADPEAPHWSVNVLPIAPFDGVDTTLDLDLGDYPIIGQVSRWFCIIDLCLGLVFATKKLIWTA